VVDGGPGVGADVEGLVELQDDRDRPIHLPGGDGLAVHLQDAGAAPPDPAQVVEREGGEAQAVVPEVEDERVPAGREGFGPLPFHPLEVEQVPGEDGLAPQQIEAVSAEASAVGVEHALGPSCGISTSAVIVYEVLSRLGASPGGMPVTSRA